MLAGMRCFSFDLFSEVFSQSYFLNIFIFLDPKQAGTVYDTLIVDDG